MRDINEIMLPQHMPVPEHAYIRIEHENVRYHDESTPSTRKHAIIPFQPQTRRNTASTEPSSTMPSMIA